MKNYLLIFLLSLSFILSVFAQSKDAQKIDEFGILSCGDFSNRMDGLIHTYQQNPESEIYVIYYGARYRKTFVDYEEKKKSFTKLKLSYPHRNDGLNRAKSIPLYLATYYSKEIGNSVKDRIKLVDGGFRENIEFEIWLVPTGTKTPKSSPLIDEKYIKFSNGKPFETYNYANCY